MTYILVAKVHFLHTLDTPVVSKLCLLVVYLCIMSIIVLMQLLSLSLSIDNVIQLFWIVLETVTWKLWTITSWEYLISFWLSASVLYWEKVCLMDVVCYPNFSFTVIITLCMQMLLCDRICKKPDKANSTFSNFILLHFYNLHTQMYVLEKFQLFILKTFVVIVLRSISNRNWLQHKEN